MVKAAAPRFPSGCGAGNFPTTLRRLDLRKKSCRRQFRENFLRHAYGRAGGGGIHLGNMGEESFLHLLALHVVSEHVVDAFLLDNFNEFRIVAAGIASHKNARTGELPLELLQKLGGYGSGRGLRRSQRPGRSAQSTERR